MIQNISSFRKNIIYFDDFPIKKISVTSSDPHGIFDNCSDSNCATMAIPSGIYSDILSAIRSGIFSGIHSGIYFRHLFWHDILHILALYRIYSYILSDIFSDISFGMCSGPGVAHCIRSWEEDRSDSAKTELKERLSSNLETLTWWGNKWEQPPFGELSIHV